MTASGTVSVQTPIAGLVELALRDPCLQDVISRAADRPAELKLIGPAIGVWTLTVPDAVMMLPF